VYPNARCCLAIHNLAHQGSFETHAFSDVGLSGDWYSTLEWESPDDRNRRKTVNILKVCSWADLVRLCSALVCGWHVSRCLAGSQMPVRGLTNEI
jgi:glycogen synthase